MESHNATGAICSSSRNYWKASIWIYYVWSVQSGFLAIDHILREHHVRPSCHTWPGDSLSFWSFWRPSKHWCSLLSMFCLYSCQRRPLPGQHVIWVFISLPESLVVEPSRISEHLQQQRGNAAISQVTLCWAALILNHNTALLFALCRG